MPSAVSGQLDLIRLAVLAPVFLNTLVLIHTRLYQRWYPIIAPYGAAVFGIGVVALVVIAASATPSVSLIASAALATIYNCSMFGVDEHVDPPKRAPAETHSR